MNNVNVMGRVKEKVDAGPPELSPFKVSATTTYTLSSPHLSFPRGFSVAYLVVCTQWQRPSDIQAIKGMY